MITPALFKELSIFVFVIIAGHCNKPQMKLTYKPEQPEEVKPLAYYWVDCLAMAGEAEMTSDPNMTGLIFIPVTSLDEGSLLQLLKTLLVSLLFKCEIIKKCMIVHIVPEHFLTIGF